MRILSLYDTKRLGWEPDAAILGAAWEWELTNAQRLLLLCLATHADTGSSRSVLLPAEIGAVLKWDAGRVTRSLRGLQKADILHVEWSGARPVQVWWGKRVTRAQGVECEKLDRRILLDRERDALRREASAARRSASA